jgi:hypothetical protein
LVVGSYELDVRRRLLFGHRRIGARRLRRDYLRFVRLLLLLLWRYTGTTLKSSTDVRVHRARR